MSIAANQITVLKKEIEEKDEMIWQLGNSLKIEKEIGDKLEELVIKTEQEMHLYAASELDMLKRESKRKCQLPVLKEQDENNAFEAYDRESELVKENDDVMIKEMEKPLKNYDEELLGSLKDFKEMATASVVGSDEVRTDERSKVEKQLEEILSGNGIQEEYELASERKMDLEHFENQNKQDFFLQNKKETEKEPFDKVQSEIRELKHDTGMFDLNGLDKTLKDAASSDGGITKLKKAIIKKNEKICQLENSLKIERKLGENFEVLLKCAQEKYLDATKELETVRNREITRYLENQMSQMRTYNKTLQKNDVRNDMIKEKNQIIEDSKTTINEMKQQLQNQERELSEHKKALEEINASVASESKRAATCKIELEKCHTLISELQHQKYILEAEAKIKEEQWIKDRNAKDKQLEEKLSVIVEKEKKIGELELKFSKEKKDMESEVAAYSHKLQEKTMEQEKKDIQKELLQKKLEGEMKAKDMECEDLKRQVESKNNTIISQKEKIDILEKDTFDKEISIEKLNKNIKELRNAKDKAENHLKQLEEVTQQISKALQLKERLAI